MNETIFDFIKKEETAYQKPIRLEDGWFWSMKDHLRRSYLYKHSQFAEENDNRDLRPNKNIIRPILNIQYRTEGFDVKDIELYVDDPEIYYKSFLVKKYHDVWVLENLIDTFIDEVVESYVDYGGVLVRDTNESRPEVIDLRGLAFCDQTDILGHPFVIKHKFTPAKLRTMDKWGKEENGATINIETFIVLTKDEKEIEIYELHGTLPGQWLNQEEKDVPQIQIVAFYKDQNNKDIGVCLFKHREPKLPFKFLARDGVSMRALGFGGVEELLEAQIWTNWSEVKITEMLEAASKQFFKSTDPSFKTRNNLRNVDNLEVLTLQQGGDLAQVDTSPRNLVVFNNAVARWEAHAQQMGAASEGLLGESPTAGTPFKLFEAQNIEARGMHHYRQGKIAVFIDEIYRDWILPHIAKEITKGQKFLTELSFDELQSVSKAVINKRVWDIQKEKILNGELILPEDTEVIKAKIEAGFFKGGNKKFIKILKDELKDVPIKVRTNIAGKQKNLALLTDKIVNLVRQFIATPEIRQDPEMVKLLNVILESSGMSPIVFGASPVLSPIQPRGGSTEPLKTLGAKVGMQAKETAMR